MKYVKDINDIFNFEVLDDEHKWFFSRCENNYEYNHGFFLKIKYELIHIVNYKLFKKN